MLPKTISYDHALNLHTKSGPQAAFPGLLKLFSVKPTSMVDVGCGTGVWLRAAIDNGVADTMGIDGVAVPEAALAVPRSLITIHDLTTPINVDRRFDLAICLEVAEHLDEQFGPVLVKSLTNLADTVLFSAACPDQQGQHHVNCQWPAYWQHLFNERHYSCDDSARWAIWDNAAVEPWYRQNMLVARRDPAIAGKEKRIPAVLHPNMATMKQSADTSRATAVQEIEAGGMPAAWYCSIPFAALAGKIKRRLGAG